VSSTPIRPARELLSDSEATLRLVDTALAGLDGPAAPGEGSARQLGLLALTQLMERGHSEIVSVLESLRESRSWLEQRALEQTHEKLREVSNATEIATANVLDGLERAVRMIDELDAGGTSTEAAAGIRVRLRDELFGLMGQMQFQDITTQQLTYASSVLSDIHDRLAHLVAMFDPQGFTSAAPRPREANGAAFDPAATLKNAEERQSVADEIFTRRTRG
jgi:hypothetical protein